MQDGISACLIVRNESNCLERCLSSLKGLANEIIIVDTGSEDNTVEIAKKFTDKIFYFKWVDDFSEARNFAISKASFSWILSIDADEVISDIDKPKILSLINKNEAEAYLFILRDYTNELGIPGWTSSVDDNYPESKNNSGYYTTKVLRFFKNQSYLFQGGIHETVHASIKEKGGKIFDSSIVIHHFGNLDRNKYGLKTQNYIIQLKKRLDNKDFKEKSEDYICYEISKELASLEKYPEAIIYLERAIILNESFDYLFALGALYLIQKNYPKAEQLFLKAVNLNSKNASLYNNLGILYSEKGEYEKAIRKLEKAILLNPKNADSYYNLGLVYKRKNKKEKAKNCFEKAIELNPKYEKICQI